MIDLVHFSSVSNTTQRFVDRLGIASTRIPVQWCDGFRVDTPFVLVTPTYGGSGCLKDVNRSVPKQVVKFLNDVHNRKNIRGVIASGDTNFGSTYCAAGSVIARKCGVPFLYRFELIGTPDDLRNVRDGLEGLPI
jgi:protein involved in ribonucleotide reduction